MGTSPHNPAYRKAQYGSGAETLRAPESGPSARRPLLGGPRQLGPGKCHPYSIIIRVDTTHRSDLPARAHAEQWGQAQALARRLPLPPHENQYATLPCAVAHGWRVRG